MKDQFWPFAECWDGWRGVRIGSPVVVMWHVQCRGTTLALCVRCEISCRLHDGVVLGKRIVRSSMRTPAVRGAGATHGDGSQGAQADRSVSVGPDEAGVVAHRGGCGAGVIARGAYGSCPVVKQSKPWSNDYLYGPSHK
ncbi:hypothetical protein GCM10010448_16440 [Streptomyces glomeratus]|uniref:Uncharacterized protein n=1 Tax=Streptomyces glomeratus TaxID=284452 RepID=A0ABP6L9F4_9ACTN